jgi:hypothetical protein
MIRKLVNWLFNKEEMGSCGVCGGHLDEDYGELKYKSALEEDPATIFVCSNCIEYLEMEHQRFVQTTDDWKKHEEL